MFFHDKRLQYHATPDRPDPIFARRLQEVLGGQWGEISVMMTYLFQGWNARGPAKYKDMLLDIGTEEMAHVEMLSTMIARLLEGAPLEAQASAVDSNPAVAAIMGGINPQHAIVSGLGAQVADSVGVPWNGRYAVASGNMLADFRYNVTAESQGRLQVCRLYEMTEDAGVRDMLSFLIARDTMHQNQWLAAIAELEADGLDMTPAPNSFPQEREFSQVAYQFQDLSEGEDSAQGRWASGPSMDGKGEFSYVRPEPMGEAPELPPADPRVFGTAKSPILQKVPS
ncbi:MAG: manganese catalase family protein [Chloroflexota bacterium]|nr:manganese catalase family protein [Chloroflexota bacterium]MDP9472929.1 manganese catalase family protein [Chloroflexota bacterium]